MCRLSGPRPAATSSSRASTGLRRAGQPVVSAGGNRVRGVSDYYTLFLAVDLPPDLPEPVLQELRWLVGQDEMPAELESERASPEIAPALAAIRTLDLKVVRAGLSGATAQRYLSLQETVYCGKRAKPPPGPSTTPRDDRALAHPNLGGTRSRTGSSWPSHTTRITEGIGAPIEPAIMNRWTLPASTVRPDGHSSIASAPPPPPGPRQRMLTSDCCCNPWCPPPNRPAFHWALPAIPNPLTKPRPHGRTPPRRPARSCRGPEPPS